jgi:crotonobetainyl-CoA:carnitine CoA-transferase CaiB-like acyl-CoA transferase
MAGLLPLEGIKVLDWTQWQMGTVATAMLAEFGAEVVHIENRLTGDAGRGLTFPTIGELPAGRTAYFETNNRGKKSLAIDLIKPEGKEIIYRLVKKADVFVHNFRQGVPEKLKLDYETIRQHNPDIIYAAASGYGPRGPEAQEPAFDMIGLARSGIATATGIAGDPNLPVGGGLADQMGAVMTSYGILMALLARERLGVGQKVDVSHLGSMMALQGLTIGIGLYLNPEPREKLTRKQAGNPLWNYYQCADGRWLVLGMLQPDRQWPIVCKAMGIEHLTSDPRFEDADKRRENSEELINTMDEIFITKTADEWMKILKGTGDVICTPLQTIHDLRDDPQVIANDYIIECEHEVLGKVKVRGLPVELSRTPGRVIPEAPECGQHTEEVLIEMGGYTWEDIAELRDKEVI